MGNNTKGMPETSEQSVDKNLYEKATKKDKAEKSGEQVVCGMEVPVGERTLIDKNIDITEYKIKPGPDLSRYTTAYPGGYKEIVGDRNEGQSI